MNFSDTQNWALKEERSIGEWIYQRLSDNIVVEEQGWAFDLVQRVAQRLNRVRKNSEPLEPIVLWIPQVTAFIVPGRYLYISRELLQRLLYEDAVALVIAHEMAHFDLNHISLFSSTFSVFEHFPGSNIVVLLLLSARNLWASSKRELIADDYALELCLSAGYDSYRCLELFDVLTTHHLDFGDLIGVFGSKEKEESLAFPSNPVNQWVGKIRQSLKEKNQSHPNLYTRRQRLLERLQSSSQQRGSVINALLDV